MPGQPGALRRPSWDSPRPADAARAAVPTARPLAVVPRTQHQPIIPTT